MAEALGTMNVIRFFWDILPGHCTIGLIMYQCAELSEAPNACLITDCKGLFDGINRSQSAGLRHAGK